jgi:predicted ArsR family transcriptional regulator
MTLIPIHELNDNTIKQVLQYIPTDRYIKIKEISQISGITEQKLRFALSQAYTSGLVDAKTTKPAGGRRYITYKRKI